jgi:hypothetical protein
MSLDLSILLSQTGFHSATGHGARQSADRSGQHNGRTPAESGKTLKIMEKRAACAAWRNAAR